MSETTIERAATRTTTATPTPPTSEAVNDAVREAYSDDATIPALLFRDGLLLMVAMGSWGGATALLLMAPSFFSQTIATLSGLLVGAAGGIIMHEWGHFAGARLSGGTAATLGFNRVLGVFRFDFRYSDTTHFKAMSWAGNIGHWGWVALLVVSLGFVNAGTTALICGALGFATSASITEFPIIRKVHNGEDPLTLIKAIKRADLRRHNYIGAVVAVAALMIL